MLWLLFTLQGTSRRHALKPGDTLVGRGSGCDIPVDHLSVSRAHARLHVADDVCVLTDLGSRNGTYRNGDPVSKSRVEPGDRLTFGQVSAQLQHSVDDQVVLLDAPVIPGDQETVCRPAGPADVPSLTTRLDRQALSAAEASRWLALLSETARMLVQIPSLGELLNRVVDLTFKHISAERAFVLVKDRATGELVPRVLRRRDGSAEQATISRTVASRVMTDRVAMLTADVGIDQRLTGAESALIQGLRSLMCAPLWSGDQVFGVLYVDSRTRDRFSAQDLDLLVALANYSSAAIEQTVLTEQLFEVTRMRARLERYHSPAVVARILESSAEGEATLTAMEREVTVLFADIVGFSTIARRLTPGQLTRLLNRYFGRMTDVIFSYEGTIDKFIGDAILAIFGAPFTQPDHPTRAVRAALAMRRATEELNAEAPGEPLHVRFGVSSGLATVGDIGSTRRREFTVLGDVVNTAARIQAEVAGRDQIVITRSTRAGLPHEIKVRALDPVILRGWAEPVDLFDVIG